VTTISKVRTIERAHFVELAQLPLTLQRQEHLRSTGQVLVN
jgi:hypothetical protein